MIRSYLGLFSRHHFNWTFGIPKWEVSQRGPLLKRLGFFFFYFDPYLLMFYKEKIKSIGTLFYV